MKILAIGDILQGTRRGVQCLVIVRPGKQGTGIQLEVTSTGSRTESFAVRSHPELVKHLKECGIDLGTGTEVESTSNPTKKATPANTKAGPGTRRKSGQNTQKDNSSNGE